MSDKKGVIIDRLQKLINSSGKSREEIAKAIECDTSTITKHYNGNRQVAPEFIIKYAQFFGVSTDYLLGLSDVESTDRDIQFISKYTGLSESAINTLQEFITPDANSIFDIDEYDYVYCEENKRFINDFITSAFFDSIMNCEREIDNINIDFISFLALLFGDYEYYYKINYIGNDIEKLKAFEYLVKKYENDSIHGALNDIIDLVLFQLQKSMIKRYETLSLLNALEEDEQDTFDIIKLLVSNIIDKTIEENKNIEFFDKQTKGLFDTDVFKDRTEDIEKLKEIYEDFKKNKR